MELIQMYRAEDGTLFNADEHDACLEYEGRKRRLNKLQDFLRTNRDDMGDQDVPALLVWIEKNTHGFKE